MRVQLLYVTKADFAPMLLLSCLTLCWLDYGTLVFM